MANPIRDQHPELVPIAIAALIAVVGMAALVLMDLGSDGEGSADGIITAAVLAIAPARWRRPR